MGFYDPDGPRRVLVVGWDGATWTLLDRLLGEGRMPVLQSLLDGGCRAPLRSTVPPVTPAAWTAMATGLEPGRSGVLGFRKLDLSRPSGYSPELASSHLLQGKTLFEHAGRCGESVALVGWPMTWPAFPLPGGVMLAGWPRPRLQVAPTWPEVLGRRLGPWGEGDALPRFRSATLEEQIASAAWWDRRHAEIGCRWLRKRDDGIVAVVLSGTDHLSHSLWGDPRLDEHFERADRHLAALLEAAGERVACMLVSDHGFGPGPRRRAHLGRWLHDRGWLVLHPGSALEGQGLVGGAARRVREGLPPSTWKALRDRLPGSLRRWAYERSDEARQVDLGSSEAFRVELYEGWEGIRLLREERRGELCAALAEEPFVASVKSREEVFRGDFLSEIPDVIVELAEGFCGGSALGPGPLVEELSEAECSVRAGSHRRDGVLVLSGPGVVARAPLGAPAVADVGPTLLALAGLPVPEGLDGRVLSEALLSAPAYVPGSELTGPLKSAAASAARIADLEEPLRRLGYLA